MGGDYSKCESTLTSTNAQIALIKAQIAKDPKICAANLASITAKVNAEQEHFASSKNPPSCNNYYSTQNQIQLITGQIATANAACSNNTSSTQNLLDQSTNNANTYKKSTSALNDTLNTANKSYTQTIQSLKSQISTLQTQQSQLIAVKGKPDSCMSSLASANATLASLNSKITAAAGKQPPVTNCTQLLNNANITYKQNYNNLQSQLNTVDNNNKKLGSQLTQLSTAVNQLKGMILSDSQAMQLLNANIKKNTSSLALVKTQIKNTNNLINNANAAINKTIGLNNGLNSSYKNLQNKINDLGLQTNTLNNDKSQINTLIIIARTAINIQNVAITLNNLVGPNGALGIEKTQLLMLFSANGNIYNLPPVWVQWIAIAWSRIIMMAIQISIIYDNLYNANTIIMSVVNTLNSIINSGGVSNATFTSYIQTCIGSLNNANGILKNITGNLYNNASQYAALLSVPNGPNNGAKCSQVELVGHTYPLIGTNSRTTGQTYTPQYSSSTLLNNMNNVINSTINNINSSITSLQSVQNSSYSSYSVLTNSVNTKLSSATYKFIGTYKDGTPRAIPIYVDQSLPNMKPTSVQDAMNIAASLGATVFGIQAGNMNDTQLWYTTNPNIQAAVANATKYGKTTCSNALGCGWVNQVYALSN